MFEDVSSFKKLFSQVFRPSYLKWGFAGLSCILGIGAILYGINGLLDTTAHQVLSCSDIYSTEATSSAGCVSWGRVFIDVSGAVKKPGIYQLQSGARVSEAIEMAQGFVEKADQDFIHHQLNLAEKINDGDKIYVPFENEGIATVSFSDINAESNRSISGVSTIKKVSINQASQTDLEELAGVGEKRALDIIENRPYLSLSELSEKGVVSETLFEKIEEFIQL